MTCSPHRVAEHIHNLGDQWLQYHPQTDAPFISFSSPRYARIWSEEICPSFRLLLDPERTTYRTYGLERSFLRSWSLKTVWGYVQLMRAGRRWRGIQGDSTRLGGDFIVDADGIVRLAYYSRDPTDRPSVEQLLSLLKQLSSRE